MAISAPQIAENLNEILRKHGKDTLTVSWSEFYVFVERARIKPAFIEDLRVALRQHSLIMAEGQAVVVISKDYNFQPLK